jgi:hypothetical protein
VAPSAKLGRHERPRVDGLAAVSILCRRRQQPSTRLPRSRPHRHWSALAVLGLLCTAAAFVLYASPTAEVGSARALVIDAQPLLCLLASR